MHNAELKKRLAHRRQHKGLTKRNFILRSNDHPPQKVGRLALIQNEIMKRDGNMKLKTILMQFGLVAGIVLLLSGCAGLVDSLTTEVVPQELTGQRPNSANRVSWDSREQDARQEEIYDFTKNFDAQELARWKEMIAAAVKKDCQGESSRYFTPAPSAGLETNKVTLPSTLTSLLSMRYWMRLSENERVQCIGVINFSQGQDSYMYVILPEYMYAGCVSSEGQSSSAKVTKVPYSLMYDRETFNRTGSRILNAQVAEFSIEAAKDCSAISKLCELLAKQPDINISEYKYEQGGARFKERFKNVYTENTRFLLTPIEDTYKKCIETVSASKKQRAEAQARAEEQAKAEELAKIKAIAEWDDTPAIARADGMKNKTIVFKSLYLGMPLQDAYYLLYRALDLNSNKDFEIAMGDEGVAIVSKGAMAIGLMGGAANLYEAFVKADGNGNVIAIELKEVIVDKLFAAKGMDGSAFADQFVKAYSIPQMDLTGTFGNPAWTYTSKDGAKLTIDSEKTLLLEKVAGQQDLKKAFN